MDLGLKGRTALVFGAGGGLGGAIARALAAEGANVVAADIDADALQSTVAAIKPVDAKILPLQWDISDLSVIENRFALIEKEIGPVDILVNNTGGPPPTPAQGQAPERWNEFFNSMVVSVIAITDRALPGMRARKWGRVLTSSSSGVVQPIPNLALSNALRMSLVGWSKTLAAEVGSDGVTVNVVIPGRIATKRILFLDQQRAEREKRAVEEVTLASTNSIPLKRYGKPEEYADVATFLCSERAAYVTGSVHRIDGGFVSGI